MKKELTADGRILLWVARVEPRKSSPGVSKISGTENCGTTTKRADGQSAPENTPEKKKRKSGRNWFVQEQL